MSGTYTRWYVEGAVSITKNSNAVTGKDTYWNTAGLHPGDIFKIGGVDYEVKTINSNTSLTLAKNYTGDTVTNAEYEIVRNFNSTIPAQVAAQTIDLLGDVKRFIDSKQESIQGRSAYEIAQKNGYAGTEAQWVASLKGEPGTNGKSAYELAQAAGYTGTQADWLESLKAAGELAELNRRTEPYATNLPYHHQRFRGKNLGATFTQAQWDAIRAGTYDDLYVGDYWTTGYRILDIEYYSRDDPSRNVSKNPHLVIEGPYEEAYRIDGLKDTSNLLRNVAEVGYLGSYTRELLYREGGLVDKAVNFFGGEERMFKVPLSMTTSSTTHICRETYAELFSTIERFGIAYGDIYSHGTQWYDGPFIVEQGQFAVYQQARRHTWHQAGLPATRDTKGNSFVTMSQGLRCVLALPYLCPFYIVGCIK